MKKIIYTYILFITAFSIVFAQNENKEQGFLGMENTVGYITDNRGNKFIIIETEDGAKLVKVKENPKKLFDGGLGISKEDLKDIKVK